MRRIFSLIGTIIYAAVYTVLSMFFAFVLVYVLYHGIAAILCAGKGTCG